jgi:hypothetical protein
VEVDPGVLLESAQQARQSSAAAEAADFEHAHPHGRILSARDTAACTVPDDAANPALR